jgi:peptidyl-tRNA hydrolase
MAKEEQTITFEREKETKNTVRFQEKPAEGKPPIIGTLYVQKWFANGKDKIVLTVS